MTRGRGGSILPLRGEESVCQQLLPADPTISFPFFLRFRQCLIEYNAPSNDSRRPLFNALKYATSFPVIILSAAQRIVVTDLNGRTAPGETWHGEHPLFRMWYVVSEVHVVFKP